MKRGIVEFDKDEEGNWRAKLECGHYRHVSHRPPLESRDWVLHEAGRKARIGVELDCPKCDQAKSDKD